MYQFWLGTLILPIPPESIDHSYRSNSKTLAMIEGGELFIRNDPGLLEYRFTLFIPQSNVGINNLFGREIGSRIFNSASYYISTLEHLKYTQEPVAFTVIRSITSLRNLFSTKKICVLDSMVIRESTKLGLNVEIDIVLKEYRTITTKIYDPNRPPNESNRVLFSRQESPYISKTRSDSLLNSGIQFLIKEGKKKIQNEYEKNKQWALSRATRTVNNSNVLSSAKNKIGEIIKSEAVMNNIKAVAWTGIKIGIGMYCPLLGALL